MKFSAFILALLLCFANSAFADSLEVTAIDIYPSVAKFSFMFFPESEKFEIELPGAFNAEEIKILNPLEVENVKIITEKRENWVPPALSEIKEEIDMQEEIIRHINSRKSALELTAELLQKTNAPGKTDAKDIISYIQMVQEMKLSTEDELSDINASLKKENEKLMLLKTEFEKRMPENSDIVVKITGHLKSGNVFNFEAFTTASQWLPNYTMDLDSETGIISTRLYSRASQNTGLDYTGSINFHTRRPNENVTVPVLNPIRVGIKPKVPTRANADYAMPMMMAGESAMMKAAQRSAPKAAAPRMESTLADRSVEGFGTLTGDGRETEFLLGDIELTGQPVLILIPEQRKDAWIVVSMDNVNTPLIPARAVLRIDEQPAGSTSIPEYGLGQKQIAFGYAPQITAEKKPIVEKTGTSWFSGNYTTGYTIRVTNSMTESKKVTIRDRIPIPTDEKIKLEVKRIDPEPKERDKENRLTWELEIEPGETADITVDYTLSYPQNEELLYR